MKKSLSWFSVILLILTVTACVNLATSKNEQAELVVLSHGLGRSDNAMWLLQRRIEEAGFNVCSIDYETFGQSVNHVLTQAADEINACIPDGKIVHFVGHSLGGLVIQDFLSKETSNDRRFVLGEVVLIGTPNKGSEVANKLKDHFLMSLDGGIGKALQTGAETLGNKVNTNNISVGVIAGTKSSSMTAKFFSGPNDGLVSVESTKTENMKDFIALPVSHSAMRYDETVSEQVAHFLSQGKFSR